MEVKILYLIGALLGTFCMPGEAISDPCGIQDCGLGAKCVIQENTQGNSPPTTCMGEATDPCTVTNCASGDVCVSLEVPCKEFNLFCPFMHEVVRCSSQAADPCQAMNCPPGTVCVVDESSCTSYPCQSTAFCMEEITQPRCPDELPQICWGPVICTQSNDPVCQTGQLCCPNACGGGLSVCRDPVTESNFCSGVACGPGEVCVIMEEKCYGAANCPQHPPVLRCVPEEKEGDCPSEGPFVICDLFECYYDRQCHGKRKCCVNSCGSLECLEADFGIDDRCPSAVGTCRNRYRDRCWSDADCRRKKICCPTPCGNRCRRPVYY